MTGNADLQSLEQMAWDAVIVGAGMGGGAAAYKLASNGLRVLLLEKGLDALTPDGPPSDDPDPHKKLLEGRWPVRIKASINSREFEMWPMLGCGVGGSSLLYGATLARLAPGDFLERRSPSGETLSWPFSYADLEPYYLDAEQLFRVSGTRDPLDNLSRYELSDPPPMDDCDRQLYRSLTSTGLHPFRLHLALGERQGCELCAGESRCTMQCRLDARTALIDPAKKSGNLTVVTEADVDRLETDGERIVGVSAHRNGHAWRFRGRAVVLAAGAFSTPVLLSNSVSDQFPTGIGNRHDLVGRNLMFHASDFVAIWPTARARLGRPGKSLAFRDFYEVDGKKLGEFQSMGIAAGYGEILQFLRSRMEQSILRGIPGTRQLLRIPAYIGAKLFKEAAVFSAIVEDFPYPDNRIVADPGTPAGMRFEYRVRDELKSRVYQFRRLVRAALRPHRMIVVNQGVLLNYGHPCGTCRAGTSPVRSVVDPDCRVHGMQNLFVVDGSIMPTSGGTNPSLTIAANALRVADRIVKERNRFVVPESD